MFFAVEMSETELRRKKRRFYLAGAIMLLIGAASIAMPLAASFAIDNDESRIMPFLMLTTNKTVYQYIHDA